MKSTATIGATATATATITVGLVFGSLEKFATLSYRGRELETRYGIDYQGLICQMVSVAMRRKFNKFKIVRLPD